METQQNNAHITLCVKEGAHAFVTKGRRAPRNTYLLYSRNQRRANKTCVLLLSQKREQLRS
jgi:hypothetical protein